MYLYYKNILNKNLYLFITVLTYLLSMYTSKIVFIISKLVQYLSTLVLLEF